MLYFFLSHAPDEDETYVQRFFQDLSAAVREQPGVDARHPVGYLDVVGQDSPYWSVDARAALTSCQTFIALWSAKYRLNDRCGKSWAVFAGRLHDHRASTGHRLPGLIPLNWNSDGAPESGFPPADLEITKHRTPNDEDLRVLIRLQRHRRAYNAFVASLAYRVVETAHAERLPSSSTHIDLASTENILTVQPGPSAGRPVYLVAATGTREQMLQLRENVVFYGIRREDWSPFAPAAAQPLALHAQMLAQRRLLHAEVVPIEALGERLSASAHRTAIVVLLVDAWATRLEPFRHALHEIGRRSDAEIAVLVPVSRDDPETVAHWVQLRSAVIDIFPDRARRRLDYCFHAGIECQSEFDSDLATALTEAQHRIERSRQPARQSGAGRPILRGP
jgi:FxsC-like protein